MTYKFDGLTPLEDANLRIAEEKVRYRKELELIESRLIEKLICEKCGIKQND